MRNALRHTPDGGLVLARAEVSGDGVELSVSDSGEGIAEDDLPHIFDRFYRGHAETGERAGAGLGLAIAHQFVEAMGGTLSAKNDHGAVFTIRLPRPVGSSERRAGV